MDWRLILLAIVSGFVGAVIKDLIKFLLRRRG